MRIYLQPAQRQHVSQWLALVNQDRIWLGRWMPYLNEIQTEADAKVYVEKNARLGFYLGEQIYEIWQGEKLVGLLSLHNGQFTDRTVEIAYWLGRAYTGQSLAAAACQLIFSKVFATTAIETIYIRCEAHNYASQAIALKLGLLLEGTKAGILTYVLTKDNWMGTGYDEDDLFYFLEEV